LCLWQSLPMDRLPRCVGGGREAASGRIRLLPLSLPRGSDRGKFSSGCAGFLRGLVCAIANGPRALAAVGCAPPGVSLPGRAKCRGKWRRGPGGFRAGLKLGNARRAWPSFPPCSSPQRLPPRLRPLPPSVAWSTGLAARPETGGDVKRHLREPVAPQRNDPVPQTGGQ
jgi:hypothetical protein